ncbi:MAG: STAS/SEC14 domain-containing protein [Reyranella sp.]|uniref:STAS/SEC14 domain-containing protein n=1 Tax=Reyranella sp. TaxID=1929291 RepID=UPI001214E6FF|nr:STAS/SEC14 domain-containing protein [Reyranella sp.]TAJ87920.1 MAG: STAS/SEC14 domain-containing protein [Reyranella sp.]TBR29479.1 MAG: STAS/SEC14 domain-containing protein [Reyranella sp.]
MPLNWTIDSKAKLLTAVAEGDVTRADFEAYLDMIDQAGLHTYRKLFDGTLADTSMGSEHILAIGVRMRTSHQTNPVGPLAVVVAEDKIAMVSRVLGMLAAASRPMRVFHEVGPAREWIRKQPL